MTATRRPWWRRWPTVIAAVIVVLAAVGVFIATRSTTETAYRTATASVGNVQQTVPLTGTLAATHQQGANFAVAGKVTLVAVTPGTKVAAGQVLATIDPASLELTVTKSEATLAAAQSQLSADQVAHAAGGTGAPTDARLASDQASLESSFAALISAKQDVTDATLAAPIGGTVIAVNVAAGDAVTAKAGSSTSSAITASAATSASSATSSGTNRSTASGAGSGAAQPGAQTGQGSGISSANATTSTASTDLFVIQDLSAFQVTGTMTATNAEQITAGLNVIVTPSSSSGTVAGTMTSIDPIPTVSNGTATFPYVVTITGLTDGLYSGVSATAAVVTAENDNVLTVPTGAVKTSASARTVDRVVDGKRVTTAVTVGLSGGGTSEISGGLSAGDTVAIDTVAATTTGGDNTGFPGGGGGFRGGGAGVPRG